MGEWQPIETAPKGELLLYAPAEVRGRNSRLPERIYIGSRYDAPNRPPTHWMPLPKPPVSP